MIVSELALKGKEKHQCLVLSGWRMISLDS